MPKCRLIELLDDAERAAAAAYGYHSKFFNAAIQGWSAELERNPEFQTYVRALPGVVQARKSASNKVACSRFSNLYLVPEKLLNIRE
jgi:hypothetical protein